MIDTHQAVLRHMFPKWINRVAKHVTHQVVGSDSRQSGDTDHKHGHLKGWRPSRRGPKEGEIEVRFVPDLGDPRGRVAYRESPRRVSKLSPVTLSLRRRHTQRQDHHEGNRVRTSSDG